MPASGARKGREIRKVGEAIRESAGNLPPPGESEASCKLGFSLSPAFSSDRGCFVRR